MNGSVHVHITRPEADAIAIADPDVDRDARRWGVRFLDSDRSIAEYRKLDPSPGCYACWEWPRRLRVHAILAYDHANAAVREDRSEVAP